MDTAVCAHPHRRPDSYFPAIAAIALDSLNRRGLNVVHELIFPNYKACHWAICALAAQALPARNIV